MTGLAAHNITHRFGTREILKDVSLTPEAGTLTVLAGPNGAGKSTLLRIMAGLLRPDEGQVKLAGDDIAHTGAEARAHFLAYLPQTRVVEWSLTGRTVVGLGRIAHRRLFADADAADQDIVTDALRTVEAEEFADRPIDTLSGGELARILIARVLAQDTSILLADEPVSGLDPAYQLSALRVFRDKAHGGGIVICVLHDLALAGLYADRIVLLKDGVIAADGPPPEILTPGTLGDVYGVQAIIHHVNDRSVPVLVPAGS